MILRNWAMTRQTWVNFWEPFVWVWREWPRVCGFILGAVVSFAFSYGVMFVVVRQLIVGIGTLPPAK